MHKRTIIDQIEILKDGTIALRMAKQIVDDDGSVISSRWHRTVVPPDVDVDQQMAVVNQSLVRDLGYPAVSEDDIARVRDIVPVVHTKVVKEAFAAKLKQAEKGLEKGK